MKYKFLLVLIFLSNFTLAQRTKYSDNHIVTTRYHYGVVLPHHPSIKFLINDQISAFEINYGIIPDINRSWSQLYNRPEIGIGFYHGTLGNDEVLGRVNAVYPYINFKLKEFSSLKIELQTGFGIGHTQKHFDPTENYINVAIGSKLNAFFKLLLNSKYFVTSKWSINGGVGFQHISNGAVNVPNKGLNMLTGNLGIQYHFKEYKKISAPLKRAERLKNQISIVWSNGVKQTKEIDENKYYTTSLSANYGLGINPKQRIGFGIDFFYDESANRGGSDLNPKTNFKDRFSQAIILSHDLVIQKFSVITHIGVYTWYETKPEKPMYARVGLRYNINRNFLANLSLKAHLGKADFIEWGIGYRFNKN